MVPWSPKAAGKRRLVEGNNSILKTPVDGRREFYQGLSPPEEEAQRDTGAPGA